MKGRQLDLFTSPLARARRLKVEHRYRQAEIILRELVEREPENVSARASLADLYYRTGHWRRALALAAEILRNDPDEPRALVVTGNVLRKKGKPAEAAENFRLALRVAETDYLWLRLAACQLDLKQAAEARQALEAARRLGARGSEPARLELRAARQLGDDGKAAAILERAAAEAPADAAGFAAALIPVLAELPPARAASQVERLRSAWPQGGNPALLLFEADNLLRAKQPEAAARRLAMLDESELDDRLRRQLERLRKRLRKK